MDWSIFRIFLGVAVIGLLCLYAWIALRQDSRLETISIFPKWLAVFLDLNPRFRQIPAFALLGLLTALLCFGLPRHWLGAAFVLFCMIPVMKEVLQAYHPARHFDVVATLYGIFGIVLGWGLVLGISYLIFRKSAL